LQDIRWRAFWLILGLTFICLIVWAASDAETALISFSVGIILYLFGHLYWLNQLVKWYKKRDLASMPLGTGIWEDLFAAIYHEQRRHIRSQTQLSSALDRFRHAASALPDGVVLLDDDNKIEWCNKPAERQLGLSLKQDIDQPIVYLVRNAEFIQYLKHHVDIDPIKLKSWIHADTILEIQLVAFGSNQKLLICRDVSQLEKLEHMRRDFIANVSHELRTPLTVVGGFLETLSDMDGAIPENIRNYFGMMQDQTSRMKLLIEDLLTLSQLENSANTPDESELDINAILNTVLNESKALSHGKHLITLEADPTLALTGSNQELRSAFGNLVSNAIRYTPEGGSISMSWQMINHEAVFSVTDTGLGIEPQHLDRLTERFYRVDRSRSRETGGTGLGLSIVKHILSRHQGRLEITSEFGKGSTFKAVFPKSRVVNKQITLFK
jgi:two-component system, OmpR family, phosphate regulon sensor histidine kinase PhoR